MTQEREAFSDLPPLPEPRTLSRGDEDGAIQLGYTAAQMRAYARASLAQLASVPAGWKLVPVEPTDDMIHAGYMKLWGDQAARSDAESCWSAMLATAPAVPQPAQADAPHLFELWWEQFMPTATQAEAWAAWQAAPRADGVGVAAPQPEAQPLHADPYTHVIQHLNSSPYNLTKDECIALVKRLRDSAAPSAQAEPIAALVAESERLGLYDVPPLAELREKLGGWDVPEVSGKQAEQGGK